MRATTAGALALVVAGLVGASMYGFTRNEGSATAERPSPPAAPTAPARPVEEPRAAPDESDAPEAADAPSPDGIVFMWRSGGGLPLEMAERASGLPGVTAATLVRNDVLGLVGSRDADGSTVDAPPPGFRIPVAVSAIDPAAFVATVDPGAAAAAIAGLRSGQVLLSETSAELRRLGPGAELDLEGLAGLEVVGVVPDRAVRAAEVVLHVADAEVAGVGSRGSLLVRHEATVSAQQVGDALRSLVGELLAEDQPRVRVADGDVTTRVPLVLPLVEVKRQFGEFPYRPHSGVRDVDIDPAWVREHIVDARVPILGTVRCHRAIIDDLRGALQAVVDAGLGDWINPSRYGGCFNPRHISTTRERLSRHAWGVAIDINVDFSLPGLGPVPPDEIIDAFARHGFRWGGDFTNPDNHHYEWIGPGALTRPTAHPDDEDAGH